MSVGHVARALEEAGIPTVIIAARAFRSRMDPMTLPRVLTTPYMMGRPVGPVGDPKTQRRVVEAALQLLATADRAGTTVDWEP